MRFILAICVLVLVMTRAGLADVVTLGASHDATIFSNNVNNSNGGGPGMFAGADGMLQELRGLIQFDVAGAVPSGATINSVQLTLNLAFVAGSNGGKSDTGNRTIGLHRLLASWGEGTTESGATDISTTGNGASAAVGDATWTDRFWAAASPTGWSTPGGDFVAATSASAAVGTTTNTGYNWLSTPTLVADVQGWLNAPGSNAGWLLQNSDETVARTFRAFWTREASNAVFRPQLQINFTPVPEPAVLTPLGVLALLMVRRRTGI
ncbi:MAG TPA: DNRLRE domain-containing protein [Tepidisphaeraceae bacterium]